MVRLWRGDPAESSANKAVRQPRDELNNSTQRLSRFSVIHERQYHNCIYFNTDGTAWGCGWDVNVGQHQLHPIWAQIIWLTPWTCDTVYGRPRPLLQFRFCISWLFCSYERCVHSCVGVGQFNDTAQPEKKIAEKFIVYSYITRLRWLRVGRRVRRGGVG